MKHVLALVLGISLIPMFFEFNVSLLRYEVFEYLLYWFPKSSNYLDEIFWSGLFLMLFISILGRTIKHPLNIIFRISSVCLIGIILCIKIEDYNATLIIDVIYYVDISICVVVGLCWIYTKRSSLIRAVERR